MTTVLAARAVLRRVAARFAAIPSTFRAGRPEDNRLGVAGWLLSLAGGGLAGWLVLQLAFATVLDGGP